MIAEIRDGGGRLALDAAGGLAGADHLPSDYRRMVKDALSRQAFERSPRLDGLIRPGSVLMGPGEQGGRFSVIQPVGTVVLSDRPAFRWSALEGASSYVVEVYDQRFNRAAASPALSATSWTPPESLERGAVYSWQVKARTEGQEITSPQPPSPQARFRVIEAAEATRLAAAQRDHGASHLLLGLLYAQAGLLDDAEREVRALEQANPDSEVVRRLGASLQKQRR
jgi:hypothetical protein